MKLSLITVCRNVAPVIAESIDSVLGQEYPGIELIVIDGASTDGTLDILNAYGNKIDVLLSEPDKGIYDAMNKGLARATGDVIGFVNAGDLLMTPRTIDQVVKAFEQQNVDAVYGDIIMVDEGDISKDQENMVERCIRPEPVQRRMDASSRGNIHPQKCL
ncbi:MAG: glycosyltransferase [Flavobacteriales bacterium]|nr:glycosyltransferase [Flavobacteriales bacterium]